MKRIGAMAAVALIALLLALPLGAAMAQDGGPTAGNQPPATLFGMVTADGLPVPEGTMITAMVGDEKIGSTMVMAGGSFGPLELMMPSGDDMMVTFMVGDRMSSYTYDWMSGGLENKMITANLADAAGAMGTETGMDGAAGAPGVAGPKGDRREPPVRRARRARKAQRVNPVLPAPMALRARKASRVPSVELAAPVPWASSRSSWPSWLR